MHTQDLVGNKFGKSIMIICENERLAEENSKAQPLSWFVIAPTNEAQTSQLVEQLRNESCD